MSALDSAHCAKYTPPPPPPFVGKPSSMSALDSAHGAKYTPRPPPPPARHVRFLTVPLLRDAMRCHATPCGQMRYVMLCYDMQTQFYATLCDAMLCYACFGAGMFRKCGMSEQLRQSPYHPRPPAALPSAWPASPWSHHPPSSPAVALAQSIYERDERA